MARVRALAVLLLTLQMVLYEPPGGLSLPFARWVLPTTAGIAALMVSLVGTLAARQRRPWALRTGAAVEVAADAGIVLGVIVAMSFDPFAHVWALMMLPTLEAAWRLELRGALITWAVIGSGYALRDVWATGRYPHIDPAVHSITYRVSLVLIVTLVAGVLASSLRRAVAANAEMAERAKTDVLTDLPNRDHFLAELEANLEQGRPVAVAFFDLDGFKTVNDTLGHEAGDDLLRAVAGRLASGVRDADLIARFGGDEFMVLLRDIEEPADVEQATRRLQRTLEEPFELGGRPVMLSASIGVALPRGEPRDPNLLLRDADLAMYEAKETGRGGLRFFRPAMGARLGRRMALEHSLPTALGAGGMRLVYQPIVRLSTGDTVGFEALLRWSDPTHGDISPTETVELAGDLGIGVEVGRAVLEAACAQLAEWRRSHPDLFMTVNLGSGQVTDRDASLEHAMGTLQRCGLPADALVIEVTETSMLTGRNRELVEFLSNAQLFGMRLAMDDFGRGYSSLSRLRNLKLDLVKLDKDLIAELAEEGQDPIVLEAVVGMVRRLGLSIVAEGVETQKQWEAVRAAGCDFVQGYFYAPPVDAGTATKTLRPL